MKVKWSDVMEKAQECGFTDKDYGLIYVQSDLDGSIGVEEYAIGESLKNLLVKLDIEIDFDVFPPTPLLEDVESKDTLDSLIYKCVNTGYYEVSHITEKDAIIGIYSTYEEAKAACLSQLNSTTKQQDNESDI
jgi:hypothetical protein